ncbi:MAG: hypothetical protein A2X64_08795 [Ignavibacteria bacterium GWF2_33_9]|nr:MAG: hypothetical protein A2X64_08795 [Ignavibacteria bacterium GWF2_33_9]
MGDLAVLNKFTQIKQWIIQKRWKMILSIIIIVFCFIFWIKNVHVVDNLILDNHKMELLSKDLISENENLRRKLTQFKAPERIIKIAELKGLILNEEAPIVLSNNPDITGEAAK